MCVNIVILIISFICLNTMYSFSERYKLLNKEIEFKCQTMLDVALKLNCICCLIIYVSDYYRYCRSYNNDRLIKHSLAIVLCTILICIAYEVLRYAMYKFYIGHWRKEFTLKKVKDNVYIDDSGNEYTLDIQTCLLYSDLNRSIYVKKDNSKPIVYDILRMDILGKNIKVKIALKSNYKYNFDICDIGRCIIHM